MNKNEAGLSLVELLIVVTVLCIIAAIAGPNMMASRRAANEGSAVSSMRTIFIAESTYLNSKGKGNYASLETLAEEKLLDNSLSSATNGATAKSGYYYEVQLFPGSNPALIEIRGNPASRGGIAATGRKTYWIGEAGVMYYNNDAEDINIENRTPTNAVPLE